MRRQHSAEIRHSFSICSCNSPVVITDPKCPLTRGAARQLMRVKTAVRLEEGESPDVEPPFLPIPRLLLEHGARARAVDRVHPAGSSSADVYTSSVAPLARSAGDGECVAVLALAGSGCARSAESTLFDPESGIIKLASDGALARAGAQADFPSSTTFEAIALPVNNDASTRVPIDLLGSCSKMYFRSPPSPTSSHLQPGPTQALVRSTKDVVEGMQRALSSATSYLGDNASIASLTQFHLLLTIRLTGGGCLAFVCLAPLPNAVPREQALTMSALSGVVQSIKDGTRPRWRDAHLTRLLQRNISHGDGKMLLLASVAHGKLHAKQTIAALNFLSRARTGSAFVAFGPDTSFHIPERKHMSVQTNGQVGESAEASERLWSEHDHFLNANCHQKEAPSQKGGALEGETNDIDVDNDVVVEDREASSRDDDRTFHGNPAASCVSQATDESIMEKTPDESAEFTRSNGNFRDQTSGKSPDITRLHQTSESLLQEKVVQLQEDKDRLEQREKEQRSRADSLSRELVRLSGEPDTAKRLAEGRDYVRERTQKTEEREENTNSKLENLERLNRELEDRISQERFDKAELEHQKRDLENSNTEFSKAVGEQRMYMEELKDKKRKISALEHERDCLRRRVKDLQSRKNSLRSHLHSTSDEFAGVCEERDDLLTQDRSSDSNQLQEQESFARERTLQLEEQLASVQKERDRAESARKDMESQMMKAFDQADAATSVASSLGSRSGAALTDAVCRLRQELERACSREKALERELKQFLAAKDHRKNNNSSQSEAYNGKRGYRKSTRREEYDGSIEDKHNCGRIHTLEGNCSHCGIRSGPLSNWKDAAKSVESMLEQSSRIEDSHSLVGQRKDKVVDRKDTGNGKDY